jgi:prepilin-type N-terminal cleavage/methylation domain-containing protein
VKKVFGFTLAEVLITLGIIGVVAALTIPGVIRKYEIKSLESSFKTTYSILSQMTMFMKSEDSGIKTEVAVRDLFPKYLKYDKIYTSNTRSLGVLGYKTSGFRTVDNQTYFNPEGHGGGAIILNNGSILIPSKRSASNSYSGINWFTSTNLNFVVDTNGTKRPNRLGYDVFYFQITPQYELLPSNQKEFEGHNSRGAKCCNFSDYSTCISTDNGVSCSYYALKDTNPKDNTKSYWQSLP